VTDDAELLARWRAGDAAAGRELFVRHRASVARVFRHKADDALPDLVQNTFLRCVEAREELREPDRFRAFLLGIARHELLRWLQLRAGVRGRVDAMETSIAALQTAPSQRLDATRTRHRLIAALRSLPIDLQIALELHYWEHLSGRELAGVLGVPEGTVRTRLRAARMRLRDALAGSGTTG
jgi:RNA polymerase sigma-70 factor (ECF subfamily)